MLVCISLILGHAPIYWVCLSVSTVSTPEDTACTTSIHCIICRDVGAVTVLYREHPWQIRQQTTTPSYAYRQHPSKSGRRPLIRSTSYTVGRTKHGNQVGPARLTSYVWKAKVFFNHCRLATTFFFRAHLRLALTNVIAFDILRRDRYLGRKRSYLTPFQLVE